MDTARIAELLRPYLTAELPPAELEKLRLYLDLLLRWNAPINLTAVRDPEQIVSRHFGESLFAASVLQQLCPNARTLADVGSGAGFPGIPIKLALSDLELTLIESQNKKATFLREIARALQLEKVQVFCGRAEQWQHMADIVTLRAVERFERALPIAAALVPQDGTLCLLIGAGQLEAASQLLSNWKWSPPVSIPNSHARAIATAQRIS